MLHGLNLRIWKSEGAARDFLYRKHPLLGERWPIDLVLKNEIGADLVRIPYEMLNTAALPDWYVEAATASRAYGEAWQQAIPAPSLPLLPERIVCSGKSAGAPVKIGAGYIFGDIVHARDAIWVPMECI